MIECRKAWPLSVSVSPALELDHPRIGRALVGTGQRAAGYTHHVNIAILVGGNAIRLVEGGRCSEPLFPQRVATSIVRDHESIMIWRRGARLQDKSAHGVDLAVPIGRDVVRGIVGAGSGLSLPKQGTVATVLDYPSAQGWIGEEDPTHDLDVAVVVGRHGIGDIIPVRSGLPPPEHVALAIELDHPGV